MTGKGVNASAEAPPPEGAMPGVEYLLDKGE
jgi:hypothetical protein